MSLTNYVESKIKTTRNINNASGLIIIGGDGTLLKALRSLNLKVFPIIYAINYGSIGYLLLNNKNETDLILDNIKDGKKCFKTYKRKRLLLKGHGYFLNEIIITNKVPGKLNTFNLYIDNEFFVTLRCDSVIVATSSGSTGYNASARGPIVENDCDCIIVNAVSPFKTSFTNYVINLQKKIKIEILANGCCIVDGCETIDDCEMIDVIYDGNFIEFAYLEKDIRIEKRMRDKLFE